MKTLKKSSRIIFYAFLTTIIFSLAAFSSYVFCGPSSRNNTSQTRQSALIPSSKSNSALDVTVSVFLNKRYEFLELDIRDEVIANVSRQSTETPTIPWTISVAVPFSLTNISGLPEGAYYTYGFWGYPPSGTLSVYLPANTSFSSICLEGYLSGSSVLWRTTAEVPFLNVTSSLVGYNLFYNLILVQPLASRLLRVYSMSYPNIVYKESIVGEQKRIVVSEPHPRSPIVVLYEPQNWEPCALVLMIAMITMVYAAPYVLRSKVSGIWHRAASLLPRASLSKLTVILKLFRHEVSKIDSRKLLTTYVLCGILMISLSLAAGPDPRLKVYVLASTPRTATIISDSVERIDAVAITIYDEMNEFKTLVDLGVFSAIIVGDFYPPIEWMLKGYIYPGLDLAPRIIIVEDYAFSAFSSEIYRRYADKTTTVKDLNALNSALYSIPRRVNTLGLEASPTAYIFISAIVGFLSFVIVFLGSAFLASKLIEVGKKPGVGGIPEAIAYSIFVFIFNQMIYIVCSVMLAMPLGLHATASKVTAIGFLGFGGGTKLRMFAGLLGFLFGSFTSLRGVLRIDKVGFASFLIVSFFILIDPLTNGVIFYEFVLLYTVGPTMEHALASWSYVRSFLYSIATVFGAWISPTYAISTGTMLYFVGAIPFFLFAKLKRSTATILLFFCAFCCAQGGIRIADMNPWKIVASAFPGVIAGAFFVIVFCLLNLVEKVVREKISWRLA